MSAWANRKAAVQAEADALASSKAEAAIAQQHAALQEKDELEVLAELDLPNPDEMQAGDDFSAFMKANVPDALRNRALRKLWTSNPALANVDMLLDYGEDFTGKNDPVGLINTVYRVGKGMLPDEEATEEPVSDVQDTQVEDTPTDDEDFVEVAAAEPVELQIDEPSALSPRRRMRFDFGEGDTPTPGRMETQ